MPMLTTVMNPTISQAWWVGSWWIWGVRVNGGAQARSSSAGSGEGVAWRGRACVSGLAFGHVTNLNVKKLAQIFRHVSKSAPPRPFLRDHGDA